MIISGVGEFRAEVRHTGPRRPSAPVDLSCRRTDWDLCSPTGGECIGDVSPSSDRRGIRVSITAPVSSGLNLLLYLHVNLDFKLLLWRNVCIERNGSCLYSGARLPVNMCRSFSTVNMYHVGLVLHFLLSHLRFMMTPHPITETTTARFLFITRVMFVHTALYAVQMWLYITNRRNIISVA
ncbi:unnamed protein product [Leuciscus chuanchicus]